MQQRQPATQERTASAPEQQHDEPDERELLRQIVRSQMMLNSKLFEYLRSYQQSANWGRDQNIFTDGSARKTKTGELFDEVNQIGYALSEAASAYLGERFHEKRDDQGRVLAHCKVCRRETPFIKMISSPYGVAGAYMDGTERLVCSVCEADAIYPGDERLPEFNSIFRAR